MTFKIYLANRNKSTSKPKLLNVTLKKLKEILHYNPVTGIWTWVKPTSNRVKIGTIADSKHNMGYIALRIQNKAYLAHRLAWFYMTGEWPAFEIDHKDTNKSNNKWSNLRKSTHSQNGCNKRKTKANKTGYKGVYFTKDKNRYCAQIFIKGKRHFLGYFIDMIDAYKAYCKASKKLHKEFGRSI